MKNNVAKGDILIDYHGNKMVVVDPLTERTGDCYVLLNGKIKLINTFTSLIIKKEAIDGQLPKNIIQERGRS